MKKIKLTLVLLGLSGISLAQRPDGFHHNVSNSFDPLKNENRLDEKNEDQHAYKIRELELNSSVSIYPNPSHGEININYNEKPQIVEVIDMTGKQVKLIDFNLYGTENCKINLMELPKGVYFIRIKFEPITIAKKIILCE